MSTSAEATRNQLHLHPVEPQPTPVIIKLYEEGESPDAASAEVGTNATIFSPMVFTDSTGETWEVSESTYIGRIREVSVWEDNVVYDILVPLNERELTSIQIQFGPETQVVLREEGDLQTDNIHLFIESEEVPFNIDDGAPRVGEWNQSSAKFTPRPTRIIVQQGQVVLPDGDRELHGSRIFIYPDFNRIPSA